jgi:hypothetical protein
MNCGFTIRFLCLVLSAVGLELFAATVLAQAPSPPPDRGSGARAGAGVAAATPAPAGRNAPSETVRERIAPNGTRIIERMIGVKVTTLPDGSEQRIHDSGVVERQLKDGTLIQTFPSGQVQTLYPDGRKLIEADTKDDKGRKGRIAQMLGKDGKPVVTRLTMGGRVQITYPDNTFAFEYIGEDDKGGKLTLTERFGPDGHISARELVNAHGRKREGEEEWTIKRWQRSEDDKTEVQSVERYGRGGSVVQQQVLEETRRPVTAGVPMAR